MYRRPRFARSLTETEDARPHAVSEVICVKCCRRWIAVRPEDLLLREIVCPDCGPGFVIETGQDLDAISEMEM